MILDKPIVQTYAEFRYTKEGSILEVRYLDEVVQIARDTMYENIGVRDDVSGRATYSISAKGVYLKVWIEQYMNTINDFNANEVIQQIMENIVKAEIKNIELESVFEYENLNGEILITCPKCSGSGIVHRVNDEDCPQCEGWGITFSNDPKLRITPLATKGL
jgi:rubrerythrin